MKKLALLLAALLAVLSLAPALADAAETPILFRGIEWGTTSGELREAGIWDGYIIAYNDSKNLYANPYAIRQVFDTEFVYPDELSFTNKSDGYVPKSEISDVAGYGLLDVNLFFVMIPEADGTFSGSWDSWQLYAAQYELSNKMLDPDVEGIDVQEDLTGKLSALYGDYEEEEGSYGGCRIWRGAEGTWVALKVIPGDGHTYITYGYDGADALFEQAQAATDAINAAKDAKREEFSQQTNGL